MGLSVLITPTRGPHLRINGSPLDSISGAFTKHFFRHLDDRFCAYVLARGKTADGEFYASLACGYEAHGDYTVGVVHVNVDRKFP